MHTHKKQEKFRVSSAVTKITFVNNEVVTKTKTLNLAAKLLFCVDKLFFLLLFVERERYREKTVNAEYFHAIFNKYLFIFLFVIIIFCSFFAVLYVSGDKMKKKKKTKHIKFDLASFYDTRSGLHTVNEMNCRCDSLYIGSNFEFP